MSSSLAAASDSIVGHRATNRSNRGVTVATVVCWSITSLSQTRYGSGGGSPGGDRHGKRLKLST